MFRKRPERRAGRQGTSRRATIASQHDIGAAGLQIPASRKHHAHRMISSTLEVGIRVAPGSARERRTRNQTPDDPARADRRPGCLLCHHGADGQRGCRPRVGSVTDISGLHVGCCPRIGIASPREYRRHCHRATRRAVSMGRIESRGLRLLRLRPVRLPTHRCIASPQRRQAVPVWSPGVPRSARAG